MPVQQVQRPWARRCLLGHRLAGLIPGDPGGVSPKPLSMQQSAKGPAFSPVNDAGGWAQQQLGDVERSGVKGQGEPTVVPRLSAQHASITEFRDDVLSSPVSNSAGWHWMGSGCMGEVPGPDRQWNPGL